MYQYKGFEDTICAIATAPGAGGLAVVRLSGKDALKVLGGFFRSGSESGLEDWPSFTLRHGWALDQEGTTVEELVVALMRAPKSYTCEDVVEISCHGGALPARVVLGLCLKNGARLAEPGEFTKRAFLNGRIDLSQAEAVLDVVAAKSASFLRASVQQLKGDLSDELERIRERLLSAYAGLEAFLNFPEEDTDHGQAGRVLDDVGAALEAIEKLLSTAEAGKVLREGIRVVICGKPNTGKSSLLNALLRAPRAIVTDVAGTTRDVIEEAAVIGGVPISFIDTAGILSPRDKVEEEAVRRSHLMIEGADIVILVLDQARSIEEIDRKLVAELKGPRVLLALNKSDLPPAFSMDEAHKLSPESRLFRISALKRDGLDDLEKEISRMALGESVGAEGHALLISNLRHVEALSQARDKLKRAAESFQAKAPMEIVSEDIKSAVNALDSITGREVDADLVDQIFSRFCIGK